MQLKFEEHIKACQPSESKAYLFHLISDFHSELSEIHEEDAETKSG